MFCWIEKGYDQFGLEQAGLRSRNSLRGGPVTEFYICIDHSREASRVKCDGELDLFTAPKLQEAIDVCIDQAPTALHIDGRGITLLTTAGIKLLLESAMRCHEAHIAFTMTASGHARRVLDLVGLWWLGVVDDGVRLQTAMKEALASYADLRFTGGLAEPEPEPDPG